LGGQRLNKPIVGAAVAPAGNGYWLVAGDGGVFTFGAVGFYGSTGGQTLNQPVVGMSSTASGGGYWLVAADGGIFSFGDAGFYGSLGGQRLNKPVVAMTATPSGRGYWLTSADGGVFTFGDAGFSGSMGSASLNQPVNGIAATPTGNGYWLVAGDGGIFSFGDANFYGSFLNNAGTALPVTGGPWASPAVQAGTWSAFASDLLTGLGAPVSSQNMASLLCWMNGEQPPTQPNATFNPLNIQAGFSYPRTSQPSGQYLFPSWSVGVSSTAAFLTTKDRPIVHYAGIVSALANNADPFTTAIAIESSTWAGGRYGSNWSASPTVRGNVYKCLQRYQGDAAFRASLSVGRIRSA